MFLFKEFIKSFIFSKKIRIGFVLCVFPSSYYGRIMASTRLRVYDVINSFSDDKKYFLELYKPWKKYDIVIFQKKFDEQAIKLAAKLKQKKIKIVLDINVNYYDPSALGKMYLYMYNQAIDFAKIADGIITSTEYIRYFLKKIFPEKNIICIPENITDNFFLLNKVAKENNNDLKLMYVGYAIKAKEVLIIKDVLQKLRENYNFSLIFICEKNPKISINGIKIKFIKYKQKEIHRQMLEGDIFIAPRDLSYSYNLGHSFTKIGYPMSVGIPVVASNIPSYEKSPALLCKNGKEWQNNLKKLLNSFESREKLGKLGIEFCKNNYSTDLIKNRYINFFKEIINES